VCEPEEGLCRLPRAAEDDLAPGALSEEWAHHLVRRKVPPWHIDEHLQLIDHPNKPLLQTEHSTPDIAEVRVILNELNFLLCSTVLPPFLIIVVVVDFVSYV
jgi:hypothetical protein